MRSIVLLSFLFSFNGTLELNANEHDINWEEASQFWAFVSPSKVDSPEIDDRGWSRGDIDLFVLSEMKKNGLEPEGDASSEVLIRRIFYDLIGLPPSSDELERFKEDTDEKKYERLIDSLFDRPEYGEKMASTWLNIARYAEDQAHQVGNNVKFFYPHAHRYREWVIKSYNSDLPYDQFIRLQLAADKIEGTGNEDLVALGFLGLGPQYYDRGRLEVKAEEWEDSVDVVSRGFLALTVACARCHDHKYDPISVADYHALAGVFASTQIHKRELDNEGGSKTVIHVVKDGKAQDLPIYNRGDVQDKGEVVPRAFLKILSGEDPKIFTKGSGRLELAEAISDPQNPLTARVAVNRIWQMLFGRGLVYTTSNFGHLGARPTHPELLDHLAISFIEGGWSVKSLMKKILLSSTYRQSSLVSSDKRIKDEENKFYSYFKRRRLSAEMIRDSMLVVSGELERGDSGNESSLISNQKNLRRTVYSRISRKELDHYLALFDYPDANIHSSSRDETVTPSQKLYFLNSSFVLARSSAVALALVTEDKASSIEKIYRRILSRSPSMEELSNAMEFIRSGKEKDKERWSGLAQNLIISNEFIFRD
ncbi:MAG: DUF1549 and DUF1553 domain-containing protein [Verrucomicrobiales bacterium]|nr:DUF1549 and DUF1553 domain-containing protein [Verrucomicrobiales bacterium]